MEPTLNYIECYLCKNEFNKVKDKYYILKIQKLKRKINSKAPVCKTCYELNEEHFKTNEVTNLATTELDIIK